MRGETTLIQEGCRCFDFTAGVQRCMYELVGWILVHAVDTNRVLLLWFCGYIKKSQSKVPLALFIRQAAMESSLVDFVRLHVSTAVSTQPAHRTTHHTECVTTCVLSRPIVRHLRTSRNTSFVVSSTYSSTFCCISTFDVTPLDELHALVSDVHTTEQLAIETAETRRRATRFVVKLPF
jgi:hypothetical protein